MNGTSGAKQFAGAALVVEDDALIALELSEMLEEMGFSPVDVAYAQSEAMSRAAATRYAIALVDIKLGVGEGFDVARQLRLAGSPVIFASGYSFRLPVDLAGAPFVSKPFSAAALTEAVGAAVSGRGAPL